MYLEPLCLFSFPLWLVREGEILLIGTAGTTPVTITRLGGILSTTVGDVASIDVSEESSMAVEAAVERLVSRLKTHQSQIKFH